MIRVKITKDGKYKKGEIIYLSKNEAFGLVDSGFAIYTKDMTDIDYRTKVKNVSKR